MSDFRFLDSVNTRLTLSLAKRACATSSSLFCDGACADSVVVVVVVVVVVDVVVVDVVVVVVGSDLPDPPAVVVLTLFLDVETVLF